MAVVVADLHKAKLTVPGLYVTAKEAYERWKAEPDEVIILDVRNLEELLFVGFPTIAWKIPLTCQSREWDAEKNKFPMQLLPDFVDRVRQVARPDQVIMAMCRSGGRSAMGLNLLAKAGFTQLYNIVDGMEGDILNDPNSVFNGLRVLNGWKNAGLPWTIELTQERLLLPKAA